MIVNKCHYRVHANTLTTICTDKTEVTSRESEEFNNNTIDLT